MTKEIKNYMTELETAMNNKTADSNKLCEALYIRIGFYQHERLVHLIVTIGFAVMTFISFVGAFVNTSFFAVSVLLLILDIPYIRHYYFLENSVQKLYRIYYELSENSQKLL